MNEILNEIIEAMPASVSKMKALMVFTILDEFLSNPTEENMNDLKIVLNYENNVDNSEKVV